VTGYKSRRRKKVIIFMTHFQSSSFKSFVAKLLRCIVETWIELVMVLRAKMVAQSFTVD